MIDEQDGNTSCSPSKNRKQGLGTPRAATPRSARREGSGKGQSRSETPGSGKAQSRSETPVRGSLRAKLYPDGKVEIYRLRDNSVIK